MALHGGRVRVRIKFVVNREKIAHGIQSVKRSPEMPGRPAEEDAALRHAHLQRGGVGKRGPGDSIIQRFACTEWNREILRGSRRVFFRMGLLASLLIRKFIQGAESIRIRRMRSCQSQTQQRHERKPQNGAAAYPRWHVIGFTRHLFGQNMLRMRDIHAP